MLDDTALISVIVSAHNCEKTLVRCLDTLVYQSLDEIEVIVVDDFSTDGTLAVAESYAELFPNKVTVLGNTEEYASNAKGFGLLNATGDFVAFVDAGDYVEYWAYKTMLDAAALVEDCEIVLSPHYSVQNGQKVRSDAVPAVSNKYRLLTADFGNMYCAVFRRRLFEELGGLPATSTGDVLAFGLTALTSERRVAVQHRAFYYETGESPYLSSEYAQHFGDNMVACCQYVLEHSDTDNRASAELVLADMCVKAFNKMPEHREAIAAIVKENEKALKSNGFIKKKFGDIEKTIKWICSIYPDGLIPNRVFIGAFGGKVDTTAVKANCDIAFGEDVEIVFLNENSCDIEHSPLISKAYNEGKYEFVNEYFAVKAISEGGGVYLAPEIVVTNSMRRLRFRRAFFCKTGNNTFSSKIFGGVAGTQLMKLLLKTYKIDDLYLDCFTPLSERIKTALVVGCGCYLSDSRRRHLRDGVVVYEPTAMVFRVDGSDNFAYDRTLCPSDSGATLLVDYLSKSRVAQQFVDEDYDSLHSEFLLLSEQYRQECTKNARLVSELSKVNGDLKNITDSSVWRMSRPFRRTLDLIRGNE